MAKKKGQWILWLIVIYVVLGVIYILTTGQSIKNPDGSLNYGQLISLLITGGFNQLKIWFKF